ncbi:MAG: hypothetical protein LV473_08755 [Nitrospira sp.]|nr:hypothetical protein [Nitrospira sp.]
MPEILSVLGQALSILLKLSAIGLLLLILSKLLPASTSHAFALPEILPVGLDVLVVEAAIAVITTQLAMIFTKILLILWPLAPRVSRFRGSLTEFGFGEDGLGGDRPTTEHRHCHTHPYDISVPHDRFLSLDPELLNVLPILVSIAIALRSSLEDSRLK